MGTQTMTSQTSRQQSPIQSLARQGSLYSLTLNEVQSHFGEPLDSMNLDDLLKNVLSVGGSSPFLSMDMEPIVTQYSSSEGNIPMNRSLRKKTVDEVWRDIKKKKIIDGRSSNLGEMTLEDFLMKAGVVAEGFPQGSHWLQQCHQMGDYVAGNLQGQVEMPSVVMREILDPQIVRKKRVASEDVEERTVERRQNRMIKNRESAARSRARKQAYTNELENKIALLEEENERLRRQKELDTIAHSATPPEPKLQLRRSSSAGF